MSCDKINYGTRSQAVTAARGIGKRSKRYSMHAYHCSHCGKWHLHSNRKRR